MGPNVCFLCNRDAETIGHLMAGFHFTKSIWKELAKIFPFETSWNEHDIVSCFENWFNSHACWIDLPVLLW